MERAHVARRRRGRRVDPAGQEAASEWAVRDETDSQLAAGGQDGVLDLAREDRVLALHRADRVDRVGAPQRCRRALRESEEAHFAGLDQAGHGTDGLFDRRRGIDTVLIVEVDDVGAETPEARVAGRAHVLRASVDAIAGPFAHSAELGCKDDSLAIGAEYLAEEALVVPRPVNVRGVEEIHSQLQGAPQHGARLLRLAGAVQLGDADAAEPDLRNAQALGAERAPAECRHRVHEELPRGAPNSAEVASGYLYCPPVAAFHSSMILSVSKRL